MDSIEMTLRFLKVASFHLIFTSVFLLGQDQFRPLYLSGQVALPDGSPPPEPVVIELVCDGDIQPQALTKADGGFNFRVGGDRSQEIVSGSARRSRPSAAVGTRGPFPADQVGVGNPAFVNMSHCEVRAVLAGYRSSTVKLGRRSVFESPDIGTLVLTPIGDDEETAGETDLSRPANPSISLSSLRAPEKAQKAYQDGQEQFFKEEPDYQKAAAKLGEAVEVYPDFATAWNLLAEVRIRQDDLSGARRALLKAIETDPGFAVPCVTLALLELKQGNVAAAAAASDKAVNLMPGNPEARFYHGMAYASLGDLEKARVSLNVVLNSPEAESYPRTHYLLGSIMQQAGEPEKAAAHYRRYLELEPGSKVAEVARRQLENWRSEGIIE